MSVIYFAGARKVVVQRVAIGFELGEHESLSFIDKVSPDSERWSDVEKADERRQSDYEN